MNTRISDLARTVQKDPKIGRIAVQTQLPPHVYASLSGVAKALGRGRGLIVAELIEIALDEFIEEIYRTRPDLSKGLEVDPETGEEHPAFSFCTPSMLKGDLEFANVDSSSTGRQGFSVLKDEDPD